MLEPLTEQNPEENIEAADLRSHGSGDRISTNPKGIKKLPLSAVLVIPFVLQIFAAVSLTGWLALQNGQKAVNDLATQLREEVSARIQQHLNSYLEKPHIITKVNADAMRLGQLQFKDFRGLERHFWQQMQLFNAVRVIYAGSKDGELVSVKREPDGSLVSRMIETPPRRLTYALNGQGDRTKLIKVDPNYDLRKRSWYQAAVSAGKPVWSDVYNLAQGELSITAMQPFYDSDRNFRGIMAADLILKPINDFLSSLKISKSGQTFILDRSGVLIASSTSEKPYTMTGGKAERLNAANSHQTLIATTTKYLLKHFGGLSAITKLQRLEFSMNGDRLFVQVMPYQDAKGLDWILVVVVPELDFTDQINANTRSTMWLCLGSLLLATAIGWLTARWIIRPISELSAASQKLADRFETSNFAGGELSLKIESESVEELGVLAHSFNQMSCQLQKSFTALEQANEELEQRVQRRTAQLQAEQEKSERLLLNILPVPIAELLKSEQNPIAQGFADVTVLFADIVDFTGLASKTTPDQLVALLNAIISKFDHLSEQHGLEKIKTIGDAYMVVGGIPYPRDDHAEAIANMALEMQTAIKDFYREDGQPFSLRIGINTGAVIAGVIGTKKFIYDLWGDAVNIASRMESHGIPGSIQVTEATYERLRDRYELEKRGELEIKGKGKMTTYFLTGRKS